MPKYKTIYADPPWMERGGGTLTFEKIAIVSNASMPWPCGACRQFLNEFSPAMEVIVQGGDGHTERAKLSELLPNSFGPQSL